MRTTLSLSLFCTHIPYPNGRKFPFKCHGFKCPFETFIAINKILSREPWPFKLETFPLHSLSKKNKKKISIHIDRASVFHCYLFTLLLVVLDSVKPLCLHMIQRRIQESQRSLWLNLSIASNSIDLIDPVRMLQFRLMVGKSKQASMNSMHRLMKWLDQDLEPKQPV